MLVFFFYTSLCSFGAICTSPVRDFDSCKLKKKKKKTIRFTSGLIKYKIEYFPVLVGKMEIVCFLFYSFVKNKKSLHLIFVLLHNLGTLYS